MRVVTRKRSREVARTAFELAGFLGKNKVTAIHKVGVFKLGDRIFLESCRKISHEFPSVGLEEVAVDTFAMKVLKHPEDFGVVVTENLYGDILSSEVAGITSYATVPSVSIGRRHLMAQTLHGSVPKLAGKNKANPSAMISSVAFMLKLLGERHSDYNLLRVSDSVDEALVAVIREGKVLTPDMGGISDTSEMATAVERKIRIGSPPTLRS